MQVLVRTPDRHEPIADRNPFLKPSHRTRFQVAGLQEHATTPSGVECIRVLARQKLIVPSVEKGNSGRRKYRKKVWLAKNVVDIFSPRSTFTLMALLIHV